MEIRVRGYKKSYEAGFGEGFEKCNEIWHEKIKDKIHYNHLFENDYAVDVLEELLE